MRRDRTALRLGLVLVSCALAGASMRASAQQGLGASWRLSRDEQGVARFVFGGTVPIGADVSRPAELEQAARLVVDGLASALGFRADTLARPEIERLELSRVGSSDKVAVRFHQEKDGIPGHRATLTVLFSAAGDFIALENNGLERIAQASTTVERGADEAARLALRAFVAETGRRAVRVEAADEPLVLFPAAEHGGVPELAHVLYVSAGMERGESPARSAYAVAARGEARILASWSLIHEARPGQQSSRRPVPLPTPDGTVDDQRNVALPLRGSAQGWGQAGLLPDGAEPDVLQPLKDVKLVGPLGALAYTRDDGKFVLAEAPAGEFTASLDGLYSSVTNWSGPEAAIPLDVAPGPAARFVFNTVASEATAAEVNAHLAVQRFRDWVLAIDPSETTFDFPVRTVVNINGSCNGFFDGTQIILGSSSASCANAAYSTFIWHEEGHWANVLFGSGNGGSGFGEGAADAWSLYIAGDPIFARDFYGPGQGIRSGWNIRPFCGSENPGCYPTPHDNGEVLMGALWKIRARLLATLGEPLGVETAELLFLSWFQAFDMGAINERIRDQWLALDDDDGNVSNGTPHGAQIDCGFQAQGFPIDGSNPFGLFGAGLPGAENVAPVLWSCGDATIGSTVEHHVHAGLPFAEGELFVGSSQDAQAFRGGTLLVGNVSQEIPVTLDASGTFTWSVEYPNDPGLIGTQVVVQWWGEDPAGPSGYSSSNGLVYVLE